MRIVQLSDIHLSDKNLDDLRNFFMDALIKDLQIFNTEKKIDLILFTGDLVDKGGGSLGADSYKIFEEYLINPLNTQLNIQKDRILFIPGNHDIDRESVDIRNEFYLANTLTKEEANKILTQTENHFNDDNKRIKKFKDFERQFHLNNTSYKYSNNESLFIAEDGGDKVGFALINDSWRCSGELKKEQHFVGYNQLFHAITYFKKQNTKLNIAVFHHPLDAFNSNESEEIENILKFQNFDIAIFGHKHKYKFEFLISSVGGYMSLNGRTAFNDTNEKESRYQAGYNILDLDIKSKSYTLYARKFIRTSGYRFDKDVDSLNDGQTSGRIIHEPYYPLNPSSTNRIDDLPNGYSADVNRIVRLLIGKSIYPNPYIFVRELIQNAVDACDRIKENRPDKNPKIVVNVNSAENYFEVLDDGDGMSKQVLKEHFSVIGKSISQEFNESTHNFNLIAKFGIGFISTFIVAQRVYISTKSENDENINFEITNVFKGFNYNINNTYTEFKRESGTTVRVYLKREYNVLNILNLVRSYCRHIDNLDFYFNSILQKFQESWNTENATYKYTVKNSKFECRLAINPNPRHIITSNSGFLINIYSPQIIPYKFPFLIGGEINFYPNAIDFDISRSNIIETDKSIELKKQISISLRMLFREVIEKDDLSLKELVLNYLLYYVTIIDTARNQFELNYSNFYSKKELIDMCADLLKFQFRNKPQSLSEILNILELDEERIIYFHKPDLVNEFQDVVAEYLYDQGNFVFNPKTIVASFRDGQNSIDFRQAIQIICQEFEFKIVDVKLYSALKFRDIKMDKDQFSKKLTSQLSFIEKENSINIDIVKFNKNSKPYIKYNNYYFINYENAAFQNLLQKIESYQDDLLKIYLTGLLGLPITILGKASN